MVPKLALPISLGILLLAPWTAFAVSPPEPSPLFTVSTPLGEVGLYEDRVNLSSVVVLFDYSFSLPFAPRSVVIAAVACLGGVIVVACSVAAILRARGLGRRL